jgi:hypothetical protein
VSTIGALPFTASQMSSLLGLSSPSQSAASGLAALLDPSSSDPATATDGILAALAPSAAAGGDTGLASLFGPATTVDPGTAGILETIQQADSATNATFDQSLPSASQSAGPTTGSTGNNVDISA